VAQNVYTSPICQTARDNLMINLIRQSVRALVCGERICFYQDCEIFMTQYCTFNSKHAPEQLSAAVNLQDSVRKFQVRMSSGLLDTLLEDFRGLPQSPKNINIENTNLY
jgi:hypothetical protein